MGPLVCESNLTLKNGSKKTIILLKTGKQILVLGFGSVLGVVAALVIVNSLVPL